MAASGVPGGDASPSVYTISPGRPFVDVLAESLLAQAGDDPLSLAATTVLLPTRRACRAMAEAFLRLSDGRTVLLPRLTPLGDMEEDGPDAIDSGQEEGEAEALLEIPPAISALKRQMLLARLILARAEAEGSGPGTPAQALALARELARLLDQMATERVPLTALADLVPEELAGHWQETLRFLEILTENWPNILAGQGELDPADRRNLLLARRLEAWAQRPPSHPVIAAGSTGSIPATADLLALIARLPNGRVILPGLDPYLSDRAWAALAPSHPQYGLAQLLRHMEIKRHQVAEWAPGLTGGRRTSPPARSALISAAMRPAPATGAAPAESITQLETALGVQGAGAVRAVARDAAQDFRLVECGTSGEEAEVSALILRQTLETPGKTAALVTPDMALARRVAAEMRRWGVDVDSSAGVPLNQTPPGAFLRLTAAMMAEGLSPVALLAALKHPLAAMGWERTAFLRTLRRLERRVLRGVRPDQGIAGLRATVQADNKAKDDPDIHRFLDDLETVTAEMGDRQAAGPQPFADLFQSHVGLCEALAATDETAGADRLWRGDDGEAAALFVTEAREAGAFLPPIEPRDYPALLDALMAGRPVRPKYGRHPRVFIWGLLEARLQHADVMVLAGLNEGTWPPEAPTSPWMGRQMLDKAGLPQPERRIGLTAHDFAQAAGAPEVVLTRAARVEGAPTRPARWLIRLDAALISLGIDSGLGRDDTVTAWATALDQPARPVQTRRPRPVPPLNLRPDSLSVTRVETWIRDPYAIYAERILRLRPLDPLDADPGAADRGMLIHEALERFNKAYPAALEDDAEEALLRIGREVFRDLAVRPGIRAFWWPRFERIVQWYVARERTRRAQGYRPLAHEVRGKRIINAGGGSFTLTAEADRIDRRPDGSLAILDYKTGGVPSWRRVEVGLSPQLPLEAVILAAGGFDGLNAEETAELIYLRLTGGRVAGEERAREDDVSAWAEEALDGLKRRITRFQMVDTPYPPRERVMLERTDLPYDHLARLKEWDGADDPGSSGGGS